MQTAFTSVRAQRRYYDIDLLRFFAAVSVMFLHYLVRGFADGDHQSPVFYGSIANFFKYNYLAVNLFFMISGFVILMTAESGNAWSFLRSRILRLYPAYWFCVTVSFVLTYCFTNHIFNLTFPRYIVNLTMLNGFFGIGFIDGVYWTLLVELKFYILILIILLLGKIAQIEYFLLAWLLIGLLQVILKLPFLEKYLITNFAAFFIAGCVFYRISKNGLSWLRIVMLAATIPLGIHFEVVDLVRRAAHYKGLTYHPEMVAIICMSFYLVFAVVILRRATVSPIYATSANKLGSLSYPLYLIHGPTGLVIYNLVGSKVDKWFLLALITLGMVGFAYFINKYVEKPLAAWLKEKLPPSTSSKVTSLV